VLFQKPQGSFRVTDGLMRDPDLKPFPGDHFKAVSGRYDIGEFLRSFFERGIKSLAQLALRFLMLVSCRSQRHDWIDTEGQGLFFLIETVVVTPTLGAIGFDEQIEAVPVGELISPVPWE